VVRHEERVHGVAVAQVVTAAETLALESESLIELDRRLVPGEHVQLELADARSLRPGDRGLEERRADSASAMAFGNHQAQIGDVRARRVGIAGERQAPDDATAVDGDVDRGVGVAAHGLEVAALISDRTPGLGGQ